MEQIKTTKDGRRVNRICDAGVRTEFGPEGRIVVHYGWYQVPYSAQELAGARDGRQSHVQKFRERTSAPA